MAKPNIEDGYLPIARELYDAIIQTNFSKRQRAIIDFIIRLSYGCGRKDCIIPRQRDFGIVGIGEGHIKRELDYLVKAKVIGRDGSKFWFNKDYEEWKISICFWTENKRFGKLIHINLSDKKTYQNGKIEGDSEEDTLPKQEDGAYQNGKGNSEKLTEKGSRDLPKREVEGEINIWNLLEKHPPITVFITSFITELKIVEELQAKTVNGEKVDEITECVFNFYKAIMKKPGATLSYPRPTMLRERLRETDNPEDFIVQSVKAILGCRWSEFHQEGIYNMPENIFGNRQKFERFIGIYEKEKQGKYDDIMSREKLRRIEEEEPRPLDLENMNDEIKRFYEMPSLPEEERERLREKMGGIGGGAEKDTSLTPEELEERKKLLRDQGQLLNERSKEK
ncbi:MAG: replication protein [Deltaproteobacteria bacterium]|uniref:Replication protein n=1 Tax=Candidatus Zymogenus saltonus TaxID=2844893 RepID=A0A9D8PS43_9DELT|nr:replication protein [Candidatus Zymogenus saltonus]